MVLCFISRCSNVRDSLIHVRVILDYIVAPCSVAMKFVKFFAEDVVKTMSAKENLKLIHICCVGYFYLLAIFSMYSLVVIAFPAIYRNDEDYYTHVIIAVFIFINMIGNQILGAMYKSAYTDGEF